MSKLSIIIPCYNEENTIISILRKINKVWIWTRNNTKISEEEN